jgi:hypothetical protein
VNARAGADRETYGPLMLISLLDVIALGAQLGALDAGSDHGSSRGVVLAYDHQLTSHVALATDVSILGLSVQSDEPMYEYTGTEVAGTGGVRFDLLDRDAFHTVRPYLAIEAGYGWSSRQWLVGGTESRQGIHLGPVALGVDGALDDYNALRAEVSAAYAGSDDVLALSVTAAFVHRL